MQLTPLHHGLFLAAVLVMASGCTTFNDLTASGADATGGGSTATDGAGKGLGTVAPSGKCQTGADCTSAICASDGTCTAATTTDGVKNGSETDVDCGGTDAPKCEAAKTCLAATDCFWGFCTSGTCEGHQAGRKDGDETDADCGGTRSPACDWDKTCAIDKDCTSTACGANLKCLVGPSCKTVHGGTTCGTGETGEAGANHETCCQSLPVTGFTDPGGSGKTVYLDKYEITSGRMRTFLAAMAAANGGVPNVKAWLLAHKPTWWRTGWEDALPTAQAAGQTNYSVSNPTVNPLYPGNDVYSTNNTQLGAWSSVSGNYAIDTGVVFALGGEPWYPEFVANGSDPGYAQFHNYNCNTEPSSEGFPTYWFSEAEMKKSDALNTARVLSQDAMDEISLNCAPTALFAAFCAWDGGQLMSKEVFDFVAGGTWIVTTTGLKTPYPPRVAKGGQACSASNQINTGADTAANQCDSVDGIPPRPAGADDDAAYRVTAPGRLVEDTVSLDDGSGPWMDLIGNLQESVLMPDGTFDGRGFGIGWSSASNHRLQMSLPRFKEASFGARCMRLK